MAYTPRRTPLTHYSYVTPIGPVTLASDGYALVGACVSEGSFPGVHTPSALTNRAATELQEYLAGKRFVFDIPLSAHGTPFQQDVWRAAAAIPYGQTRAYADIAASIGHGEAYRAVGSASRANPLPFFIPSHRIVGANRSVRSDDAADKLKEFLLKLEQCHS